VFIDAKALPYGSTREEHVDAHFRSFKPQTVLHTHVGWYILFSDEQGAYRARQLLDNTAVQGHRISMDVRTPSAKTATTTDGAAPAVAPVKGNWRFLTITKKHAVAPRRPPSPKRKKEHRRRRSVSYTSSESEAEDRDKAGKVVKPVSPMAAKVELVASLPEPEPEPEVPETPIETPIETEAATPTTDSVDLVAAELEKKPSKKRPAKPKEKDVKKKAKVEATVEVAVETPPVAEIKIEPPVVKAKPKPKPKPKALDKLIAAGTIADDEDAYWLSQVMAGEDVEHSDGEPELDDTHPLHHVSGAWRAEGWKKIPPVQKSAYLPQRNRAAAGAEESATAAGLAAGRTARITGRRLNLDMEVHRKNAAPNGAAAADASDLFAFNQLRIRKKQLRFARSAIEGYGLYAMETIQTGEMVCEYVGEVIRSAVAEIREQQYLRQGIGSSYLFRIDGDIVCDATFTGSVSRLINHSCDPSASAKIISINGQSKIVIYAKRMLHPGEEVSNRTALLQSRARQGKRNFTLLTARSCTITSSRSRATPRSACRVSVARRRAAAGSTRPVLYSLRLCSLWMIRGGVLALCGGGVVSALRSV
jgi:histone-lysine N-methyltransferase SETD1